MLARRFSFITLMSGYQLFNCINNMSHLYFLDEEDETEDQPREISEYMYWIECHPEMVFSIFDMTYVTQYIQ